MSFTLLLVPGTICTQRDCLCHQRCKTHLQDGQAWAPPQSMGRRLLGDFWLPIYFIDAWFIQTLYFFLWQLLNLYSSGKLSISPQFSVYWCKMTQYYKFYSITNDILNFYSTIYPSMTLWISNIAYICFLFSFQCSLVEVYFIHLFKESAFKFTDLFYIMGVDPIHFLVPCNECLSHCK